MLEQSIEKYICAKFEAREWLVRKLEWQGRRGAPDRFIAKGGIVLLIEFKRPQAKPSKLQDREIARLRGKGLWVEVVHDMQEGLEVFNAAEQKFTRASKQVKSG